MPPSGELYIRYSDTDNGARDIPAGTTYWLSPALEIINGYDAGTAVANDPDQAVRVWVGNQGSNLRTDVLVQVYACDFGTTNPYLQSLGGSAGTPGGPFQVPGNAHVQNGNEGYVDIGWSPATSELGGLTEKHVCLFANVHRTGDGAPQSDPPVWSIPTNQHHAQRNIKLRATGMGGMFWAGFSAANMFETKQDFVLEVLPVKNRRLAPFENRHLASARWLGAARDVLRTKLVPLAPVPARIGWKGGEGEQLKLALEPGEQVPLRLGAERMPKEPGVLRFDVVQRTARGRVVGGARLIAVTLPDELIPKRMQRDPDLPDY
jgi:hypothetical protein